MAQSTSSVPENTDEQFAIEPPRMTVLSDHPILRESDSILGPENDSFHLRSRLAAVYDIIRHKNTRAPIAIALYGGWGTGKSSAMRWLQKQLEFWYKLSPKERKDHVRVRTVWFDPWKYQTREEVWRGLIAEVIINSIDLKKASLATVANAAKSFGFFLGRSFLNILCSAKLKVGAAQIWRRSRN
jgi:predicted KAP-like P-loop ATPase